MIPTLAITFHNIVSAIFRDNMRYYAISADIWRYWRRGAMQSLLFREKVCFIVRRRHKSSHHELFKKPQEA